MVVVALHRLPFIVLAVVTPLEIVLPSVVFVVAPLTFLLVPSLVDWLKFNFSLLVWLRFNVWLMLFLIRAKMGVEGPV